MVVHPIGVTRTRVGRVRVTSSITSSRVPEDAVAGPFPVRREAFAQTIRNLWSSQRLLIDQIDPEILRLLRSSQKHWRQQREFYFAKKLRFSWIRFLSGLVSLVLVCSDVPRSGLAISRFAPTDPMLEPDVFQSFGPWFYPVQKVAHDTAANATARVWSYKFDTTSVSLRAFAEHFRLAAFPDCIMYRSQCPGTTFEARTVFGMLDSLVNVAADRRATSQLPRTQLSEPTRIALRSENVFLDRLHHYLLPQVFTNHIWRSNQLYYYPPEALYASDGRTRNICSGYRVRPGFCSELWTNFRHSCLPADAECRAVGLLWRHTLQRMRAVASAHPSMLIDLTFLESLEDLQGVTGGVSPTAVWKTDVTTIVRARECSGRSHGDTPTNCSTVYIDEYRYEVGIVYSDVKQWYRVVSSLRAVGQLYYYLRVAMLFLFAFKVLDGSATPASARPVWTRVQKTVVLLCKTPIQSVIFGSPFPILCYALAHLVDSAISYEILGKKFNTQGGIFQLHLADMFTVGFNQMRSVWLLAAFVHVCVIVSTSRKKLIWSPISGVLGVPEFLFSGISSLTIVAQHRSTHFRDSSVRKVFEVADSPTVELARYRQDIQYRGSGNMQLGGAWIDFKFFVCTLSVLLALVVTRRCCILCCRARDRDGVDSDDDEHPNSLQTRTPVPYSAGVLWPIGAMLVHWTGDYFCVKQGEPHDQVMVIRRITRLIKLSKGQVAPSLPSTRWQSMAALNARSMERIADAMDNLPSVVMSASAFHSIQLQMETLHDRGDDVEATIAFVNLVNMSDPLVYFGYILGGGGGVELGYFQSRIRRERFFLLPLGTDERYFSAHTQDLRLVYKVRSSSLSVSDLIHCG